MPDKTGYLIRAIQPEEAGRATDFIKKNATNVSGPSQLFCIHHASSIFICLDDTGEWAGITVTYLSPAERQTGIIENLAVPVDKRRTGIGSMLLAHLFKYFNDQCVFTLKAYPVAGDEGTVKFLEKFAFQKNTNGLYIKKLLPEKICLHNRRMRPKMNTINGEINEETVFEYFQKGETVWGFYSGGIIERGVLLGKMNRNGDINFHYLQMNDRDEVNRGISHSSTEFLNDGRIVLYEDWEWTGNKSGGGRSVIEEIKE